MKQLRTFTAILLVACLVMTQWAMAGDIQVVNAWSRALPPVMPNGAVYLTIVNLGTKADRVTGLSTPMAGTAQLHGHLMEGGLMKMRRVDSLALKPGESVTLKPGGHHIMLMDLQAPLLAETHFPLTITFEHALPVEVTVQIKPFDTNASGM